MNQLPYILLINIKLQTIMFYLNWIEQKYYSIIIKIHSNITTVQTK